MKKIFRVLFLGIISLFAAVNVNAATGSIEITRKQTSFDTTYNAYKLLDLSYDQVNKSYAYTINSKWADFFASDGSSYVTIDKNNYVTINDNADVAELAKKALAYAKNNNKAAEGSVTIEAGAGTGKIDGLGLGYYLVDSSLGALCHLSTTDLTAKIEEKNAEPTIEKTAPVSTGKIGDVVDYTINVTVAAGAENYVVTDKMSEGLTYNKDIAIKYLDKDGNEVTGLTASIVETATSNYTFKVDFSGVNLAKVSKIVITYSATINEKAANGSQNNNAKLDFGNNQKTISSVTTEISSVSFIKVSDKGANLVGAKFKLFDAATGGEEIKVVKESDGVYRVATANEEGVLMEAGTVTIKGLAKGTTYYLQEETAPEGFTKLADRFAVTTGTNEAYNVINTTGTLLPTTGGIGTTLFVVVGTIMVLSLGTVLVSKYRMSKFNA